MMMMTLGVVRVRGCPRQGPVQCAQGKQRGDAGLWLVESDHMIWILVLLVKSDHIILLLISDWLQGKDEADFMKKKLADQLKVSNIESKFASTYDAVEQEIKASTVSLP